MAIQMNAIEKYFPVMLFIMQKSRMVSSFDFEVAAFPSLSSPDFATDSLLPFPFLASDTISSRFRSCFPSLWCVTKRDRP